MRKFLIILLFTQIPAIAQQSIPLSLLNPELKSCQYPEHARIGHFPMFFYPATGFFGDQKLFELVSTSQFQLLHTIIAYKPHIAVFSQGILTDRYNAQTYSLLRQGTDKTTISRPTGATFHLQERYDTAWELFPEKVPQNYEHLTQAQKEFLASAGGALTAWFLGQIPHIYKTASEQDIGAITAKWNQIAQARYGSSSSQSDLENRNQDTYLQLLQDRATKLKEEVDKFYDQNPHFSGLVLIAFGASHKLHKEFPTGFSDGSFCLKWSSLEF